MSLGKQGRVTGRQTGRVDPRLTMTGAVDSGARAGGAGYARFGSRGILVCAFPLREAVMNAQPTARDVGGHARAA